MLVQTVHAYKVWEQSIIAGAVSRSRAARVRPRCGYTLRRGRRRCGTVCDPRMVMCKSQVAGMNLNLKRSVRGRFEYRGEFGLTPGMRKRSFNQGGNATCSRRALGAAARRPCSQWMTSTLRYGRRKKASDRTFLGTVHFSFKMASFFWWADGVTDLYCIVNI